MKKKGIMLAYCVPWAFLALYGDAVHGWGWPYFLMIAVMTLVAWRGVETGGVLLAGNALSLAVSLLCTQLVGFAEQGDYFKPFGAFGWAVLLTLFSALVQWLVWKKQRLILVLLAVAVGMFLGCAYWLQASL